MAVTPVLFLHPFPFDCRFWQPQIERLREAEPSRVIIAPDLRGFGANSRGPLHESVDLHAREVLDQLDARSVVRAFVVGLSMGGYVTLALHRLAPERIAGLVLADTTAAADSEDKRRGRSELALRYEGDGIGWLPDEMLPHLVAPGCGSDVKLELRRLILEQSPYGVAAAQRMMGGRPDATAQLSSIRVPTAVVCGEHDELTPSGVMRELAGRIVGSQLTVIPGAGHLSSLEAPDHFNHALVLALARVDGSQEG